MNILMGVIGQGIFIFFITILIPIFYFTAEIVGCSVIALLKKILKRTIGIEKIIKSYTFSMIFRMVVILVVCIILSSISYWNYYRIMSNPSHIKLVYVDEMTAIYANKNNDDNGLSAILYYIDSICLPLLYVLNIIYTMIINRNRNAQPIKAIGYVLFVSNGIVLAFICYFWAVAMMGI